MANAYTDTSSGSLGGTVGGAGLVQKAYDRLLEFALRAEPLIRSVADKRPARQAMPGQTVVLQKYVDLNAATSTLTETVDPDAVALSTPTSVTAFYGDSALTQPVFGDGNYYALRLMTGTTIYSATISDTGAVASVTSC